MSAAARRRIADADSIAARFEELDHRVDLDDLPLDRIVERERRSAARVERGMRARSARIARMQDRNNDQDRRDR